MMSPVLIAGMLSFFATLDANVPFPTPGAPRKIRLLAFAAAVARVRTPLDAFDAILELRSIRIEPESRQQSQRSKQI